MMYLYGKIITSKHEIKGIPQDWNLAPKTDWWWLAVEMPLLKLIHILGYAGVAPSIIPVGLIFDELWLGFGSRSAMLLTHFAP